MGSGSFLNAEKMNPTPFLFVCCVTVCGVTVYGARKVYSDHVFDITRYRGIDMAMQREAMTRVGEIVSLIGVMGSLIFVGLEVRQGAIATRAANDTVIAEAFREINQVMASSPELARALTSYAEDPESAPGPEQVQILGLWRG